MSDKIEPFSSTHEMHVAWANERGPWPALYNLLDAYERQHAENERLRARLDAAERLIEVVRAREIGTAGGVGAALEAYDAAC